MKLTYIFMFLILLLAPFAAAQTSHISSVAEFQSTVLESPIPVIVKVYTSWCPPCKRMKPIFEALSKDFQDKVRFVELDSGNSGSLASDLGVLSIPTFLFYVDGVEVKRLKGAMKKRKLKKEVNDITSA